MKFDNRFDVVSGADSKGDVVYIDRHIPQFSRKLKDKTGRPANLWKYLGTHEEWEDAAMARGFSYDRAHGKVATPMERKAVEADGVDWKEYTHEIDGYLDKIEKEKVTRPPPHGLHVDPRQAIHDRSAQGGHGDHHHRSYNK